MLSLQDKRLQTQNAPVRSSQKFKGNISIYFVPPHTCFSCFQALMLQNTTVANLPQGAERGTSKHQRQMSAQTLVTASRCQRHLKHFSQLVPITCSSHIHHPALSCT